MFSEVARFFKICTSKYFSKNVWALVTATILNVKNILLNFYIKKISLFLEHLQEFS